MIELDLVTPNRKLVEAVQADFVRVPGAKGEMEILPGHAELLSTLCPGTLVFSTDGQERVFAISYGFVEVKNDKVTILAETCEESNEINKTRAQAAQKKAEEILGATLSQEQFRKYELKLQRAVVRQQAAK